MNQIGACYLSKHTCLQQGLRAISEDEFLGSVNRCKRMLHFLNVFTEDALRIASNENSFLESVVPLSKKA